MEAKRAQAALKTGSGLASCKTFEKAARGYLAAHESSWKGPIHARQWRQCLDDYVLPKIGRLPVADVGPGDVKRVLEPPWKTKREVARKTAGKIGMILNLAIASEWRTKANPASLRIMRTVLGPLQQKPQHHPALPWKDPPEFMRKIEKRTDVPALALMWLILTCTRSSEARGCRWSELDTHKALWTLPAWRMKAGEPHTVPLSAAALWVLEQVRRRENCDYVFPGPDGKAPISETSLRNLLRECGVDKRTGSLHGMRATFRTWAAETGVEDDIAEAALAHQVPDAVVRAYKRSKFLEARRDVMDVWGLFLS